MIDMGMHLDGAVIMGLGVWQKMRGVWGPWWGCLGFGVGLALSNPWLALAMGMTGWSLSQFWMVTENERSYVRRAQAAEIFLRRLHHMVVLQGSLAAALQAVSDRGDVPFRHPEADQMLWGIYQHWKIPVLGMVAHLSGIVQQHGGSMEAVLAESVRQLHRERQRLQRRQIDEASKRLTILLLACAPCAVIPLFRLILPEFYRALTQDSFSHWTFLWMGFSAWVVLSILNVHIASAWEDVA